MTLIKLLNVSKQFSNQNVIKDFNYTFKKGGIYLLKGANGSGKSTLIKLILGLYYPNNGTITRSFKTYRYVAEQLSIKSDITVKTYITHVLSLMKEKRNERLEKTLLLELNKPLKSLSKGNSKKVLLYLAFIGNPEVIFLDEPLDGLDQKMQKVIVELMLKRDDICYIISSHNETYYKAFKEKQVIDFD